VLQRRVLEHGQREGQVAAQELPALTAGVFQVDGRQVQRVALAGGVELHLQFHSV
jgi:hypothetical protein